MEGVAIIIMNTSALPTDAAPPVLRRWFRRRLVRGLLAVSCVGIMLFAGLAWWWLSRPDLGEEVRSAGGRFHSEMMLPRYLLWRKPGALSYIVFRGEGVDDRWLHAHRAELARLEHLSLWLQKTHVTGDGLSALRGMQDLHFLNLTGTPLEDADVAHIAAISGVNQVYVARTGISGAALAGLAQLPNLTHVCIDATQATPEAIAGLATSPTLQLVTVFDADDESVRQVTQLKGLWGLTFVGEDITAASLPVLKQMQGLKELSLYDSSFLAEELDDLRQALPGCTVQQMPYAQVGFVKAREEHVLDDLEEVRILLIPRKHGPSRTIACLVPFHRTRQKTPAATSLSNPA